LDGQYCQNDGTEDPQTTMAILKAYAQLLIPTRLGPKELKFPADIYHPGFEFNTFLLAKSLAEGSPDSAEKWTQMATYLLTFWKHPGASVASGVITTFQLFQTSAGGGCMDHHNWSISEHYSDEYEIKYYELFCTYDGNPR
jgi:hypothetical protein